MAKLFKLLITALALLFIFSGCGSAESALEPAPEEEAIVFEKGRRERVDPIRVEPPIPADLPTGILVMIDNYTPARPQSGVDKADVVYEMIAEGGITRYMALFYTEAADVIGPVRSARYYFVQLAKGMDLPYAHVGGADDALAMIGNLRIKDIDELYNAQRYFWQHKTRKRPHATYTSTDNLLQAIVNKQFAYKIPDLPPISKEFTGQALADRQVNLAYVPGGGGYQVQWIWDEALGEGGQYRRYINNQAQSTAEGAPMVADTIFILAAPSKPRTINGVVTSELNIVGGGDAICIVDNKIIRGTWKKESPERPLIISDAANWPMTRKEGKTWIQVVDSMEAVRFGK